MIASPDYRVEGRIYESRHTLVLRAKRLDGTTVVLKTVKTRGKTAVNIGRLRHEYDVISALAPVPGIIRVHALEKAAHGHMLVLEDFGAVSLDEFLGSGRQPLAQALEIGVQIARALAALHKAGFIHRNITPANIVLHPAGGKLKIIDFALAVRTDKKPPEWGYTDGMQGTLRYMSPEQTGRLARDVDRRTDFYSLGATLYEVLTGKPPFTAMDPLQLVHAHLARQPVSLREIDARIPPVVSDLVMKLLAKNPHDRYRHAGAIADDLARCREMVLKGRTSRRFTLAGRHGKTGLKAPQKLFGRQQDRQALWNEFNQVPGAPTRVVLVTGSAGIGKTALVQAMRQPVTRRGGFFVYGKYDPLQTRTPYSGLKDAFGELSRQLIMQPERSFRHFRKRLRTQLGTTARVIVDLVPEFEKLLGPQQPLPALGPVEERNRFFLALEKMLAAIAGRKHPVVLCLDDLQWVDGASLKLIETLAASAMIKSLLLVGTFRDHEVGPGHCLHSLLEKPGRHRPRITELHLDPLDHAALAHMIAASLSCFVSQIGSLAKLVGKRTAGNPFFTHQFLKSLYDQKLLTYDGAEGRWRWSLQRIGAADLPGGVVELLTAKIQSLPGKTRELLQLAACIGGRFSLNTLALVSERPRVHLEAILGEAEELAITAVQGTETGIGEVAHGAAREGPVHYRFIHDRIRQAAYDLVDRRRRAALHWKIGRILLRSTTHRQRESCIFDIVNHLNEGFAAFRQDADPAELARLNLAAGHKAMAANAYDPALSYLKSGIALLNGDPAAASGNPQHSCWERHYRLCLDLHTEAMKAAYLSTRFDEIEPLAAPILSHGRHILDKIKVYQTRVQALYARNRMQQAVRTACSALALLGIRIPEEPRKWHVGVDLLKTRLVVSGKKADSIGDLPVMTDPRSLAALDIIRSALLPSFYVNPNLFPLLVFRGVRLSLRYGQTADSSFAYAGYGLILCGALRRFEEGYRFGQLALKQLERLKGKEMHCRTLVTAYTFTVHWKQHLHDSLKPMLKAYRTGIESGDIEFAALALHQYSCILFFVGEPLGRVEKNLRAFEEKIRELGQDTALEYQRIYHQAVLNLLGRSASELHLAGESYDEDTRIARHRERNDHNALFTVYLLKTMLALLFDRPRQAVKNADAAGAHIVSALASPDERLFAFYDSLATLSGFAALSKTARKQALAKVSGNLDKLEKWTRHCPLNTRHKYDLVKAGFLACKGKTAEALRLFDRSVANATAHGYVQEAALANELAARFCLGLQREKAAREYLREALYGYRKWGATAKIAHLEKRHTALLADRHSEQSGLSRVSPDETLTGGSLQVLDLATVMNASISISKEIVYAKLVDRLMHVVVQNTGAQRGVLILRVNGRLEVRAETAAHESGARLQSVPLEAGPDIPVTVANYVNRSGEAVILENATAHKLFAADPYIRRQRPRSILCFPLENKAKLVGILYLENNLASGVFTPRRLEVLKILSAQMAVSLENARLFRDLGQRTAALRTTNRKLQEEITQRRKAEAEMARYKRRLEKMVAAQSAELNRSRKTLADLTGDIRKGHRFRNMIGKSEAMQRIYTLIRELADVPATVLITGESGSGKELVAGALHAGSHRSSRPFVKVNCSALSESLLESELFGHVRGAFTGAQRHKIGRFQKAADGTVLLDEIGDVSLHFQKRLLRVLQEREFERLGDSTTLPMRARVVASTNQDLLNKVRRNEFREDLYYRLKVVEIRIPPLRERREDIPLLIRHFLAIFSRELNKEIRDVSPGVLQTLMSHDWPGNVRELKNLLEHVCILCPQQTIGERDLPADFTPLRHPSPRRQPHPAGPLGRAAILQALEDAHWNKTRAARLLCISRRTLYRRLAQYGIE